MLRMICHTAVAMLPCLHAAAKGGLVINELMQSNVDCLMVDHDFPDSWVELYNTSDQTLQISNYRLGATNVFAKAGRLSPTEKIYIGAGEHRVVCLDKTSDKPLHIAFNLETSHGELYLFDSAGQVLDSVAYGKMPAPNVALGRVADGSAAWQHELTPTPGQANRGGGSEELLPPPVFSVAGHLMTGGAQTVTVSMPDGVPTDTRIYLTTDGSEPTWSSQSGTSITVNVDRSMAVRAKLLSRERLPIRSTTHSYIFHPRHTTLPIVCIATDDSFLYSSDEGIFSPDSTGGMPNYEYDWRRPANFEYFDTAADTTVFNQCGEMAVGGGWTRTLPQKSIKCYAKKRFGKKSFDGSFWRDKPWVNSVKSFMLRNGGNTCRRGRINDAALQRLFGTNIGEMDWQAYEPVIVYVNGKYKGVYGFRERSNEDYVAANYDIDDNDVEQATEKNYSHASVSGTPNFNAFHALYHSSDVTYGQMAAAMNTENFMNAFITECYSSNTDYPQNNVAMWRRNGDGNQWQWIVKDLDYAYKRDASWNMFRYMLGTDDTEAAEYEMANDTLTANYKYLCRKMMTYDEFRRRFIAAFAVYLGDFLRPDVCLPVISRMDAEIRDEIAPTFAAYAGMPHIDNYDKYIGLLREYIARRPAYVYQQMAGYFSLGQCLPVSIQSDGGTVVSVCGIPLRTGRFDGAWFTAFPLSLRCDDSHAVWTMTVTHADGSVSTSTYAEAHISPDLTRCNAGDSVSLRLTGTDMVAAAADDRSPAVGGIYDLTGRRLPCRQRGLNIIACRDGIRRKVIGR